MSREERARLADPMDLAAQMSEDMLNADIQNARVKTEPEKHPDFDGAHCVEETCGIEIPAARLEMGRIRCVECQTRRESIARRDDPNRRS